jgi:dolichol-phosphate mannosyltransferase
LHFREPTYWSSSLNNGGAVVQRPLLILPTYNERENLEPMVTAIRGHLPQATIWIVDDNSPDGTGVLADVLAGQIDRIAVIHRPGKLGLGTAYVEAFRRALGCDFDAIMQMDADFSHDPAYLPRLLAGLQDSDVVLGSRYTEGGGTRNWSLIRRSVSRGGNIVARIGLGIKTHDATGGFRAYRRETVERLQLDELRLRGYGFQIEVVYQVERLGLTITEVPIIFAERVAGASKMSRGIALEAVLHILRRRVDMIRGLSVFPPSEQPARAAEPVPEPVAGKSLGD